MGLRNKGIYTLTADNGIKIAFTLFECLSTDSNISLAGEHIESSLTGYSMNYIMSAMDQLSFNNGAVILRKRSGWYVDSQLFDGNTTLAWGSVMGSDNNYIVCSPLVVYKFTDIDGYALQSSIPYIARSADLPIRDTTAWNGVGIAEPADGKPGYFTGTLTSVTTIKTQFSSIPITQEFCVPVYILLSGSTPLVTDPYDNGGESTTGGGGGDFDDTSDSIDFPPLPSLGATDSGFVKLFNPTLQELKNLATYMWTNPLFDVSAWKKIFADPMDAIIGLSIIPVNVPDGGTAAIRVGNIITDVSANVASAQFVEIQCGSINVNEYWGAYLDYDPYTKAELYLPYCGIHQLSVDEIMGKTIEVRYHVDILSGACCAYVKCGDSVLYTFIGQCSSSVPISGTDFTNVINGVLSAATAITSLAATGGASAPLAVPQLAATAANALKPNVEKSGAISGTGGILAIQKPYLILSRPRQALPANQNYYTGYPSFITATLGDLSGYTEVEEIHLHDVPATGEEIAEIDSLLKSGVIL